MRVTTRKCTCSRLIVDSDPHLSCRNCRPPCSPDVRCRDCDHLSAEAFAEMNRAYLRMAARRVTLATAMRRRRTTRDTLTRLRALESVLQLQSPRGTNLETLLLAEGLPAIPEIYMGPSTSTGTCTKFGTACKVLGISDHDSAKDGTLTKRTFLTVSGSRDSLQEITTGQKGLDGTSTTLLELDPDRRQGDQRSTWVHPPRLGPLRSLGPR